MDILMMHYLCLYIEGIHTVIKYQEKWSRQTRHDAVEIYPDATLSMAGANRRTTRDRQNEWKNGPKGR